MNHQARKYIESAPEAISGSGGHLTTLRVARSLYNGFALDRQEVLEGLRAYNLRLSDKWSDRELEHKADSAAAETYDKPRGWMLGGEQSGPREIYMTPAKTATEGAKRVEKGQEFRHKYILAPVAPLRSQSPRNTGAHAVGFQESERTGASGADVCATYQESERTVATGADDELGEAQRIAGELVKMHRDGAIKGAGDPEARFYAAVLHTFGGTYVGSTKETGDTGRYIPTKEQRVVVPPGLTAKQRMKFLQDDIDSLNEE
jgi:hypothetical protein